MICKGCGAKFKEKFARWSDDQTAVCPVCSEENSVEDKQEKKESPGSDDQETKR